MSEWTIDTLKEHIDTLLIERDKAVNAALAAQERAVAAALSASDRAVQKAEFAAEKRFDGVNGFREALSDQANTLMPRTEAVSRIEALAKEVNALANSVTDINSRSKGRGDGWGYIVGAIGAVAAVSSIIIAIVRH